MIVEVYTVFDSVSCDSTPLQMFKNRSSAIRAFVTGMKDNPNRNDFSLNYLGTFDTENLVLTALPFAEEVVCLSTGDD